MISSNIFGIPIEVCSLRGRHRWVRLVLLAGALFMAHGAALAAETLVAKRDGVKIYSRPELNSQVVMVLSAGAEVSGLQKKGLFWKVRSADGKPGFIMITQVSSDAQLLGDKLKGALRSALKEKKLESEASGRERAQNSVMGIRGLSDGDDVAQIGTLKPNFYALEMLENISVSADDLRLLEQEVLSETER